MRLQGYDYTSEGLYFITICVQDRECLLGDVQNGEVIFTEIGKVANDFWLEIPQHHTKVELHDHVIMPNHVHGIIEIVGYPRAAMAGTRHGVYLPLPQQPNDGIGHPPQPHERHFSKPISGSVSTIINHYKGSVKRWCNQNDFEFFRWQSRFHDHIIRSYEEYSRISNYILNNPAKWLNDDYHLKK